MLTTPLCSVSLCGALASMALLAPPATAGAAVLASTPPASPALLADKAHEEDIAFILDSVEKEAANMLRLKDISWKSVRKEFTKRAKGVQTDQELVGLAAELLSKLRDGHAGLRDVQVDMEGFGDGPRNACGLELFEADGKWFVKRATGGAEKSGVKAGWEVLKIEGEKAGKWMEAAQARLEKSRGFSTPLAARWCTGTWGVVGPDGESASFEFKAGRKKRKSTLTWGPKQGGGRLTGPLVFPDGLQKLGRDIYWTTLPSGYAYIWVGRVPGDLHELFDKAIAGIDESCTGMILDFRANLGGGYDRDAVLGRFVPKGEEWGAEKSAGPKPFTGDLVVLVDPNTISAGETIVGELKEEGRAYLIGPGHTHGASGSKSQLTVPSGKFAVRFVVHSNKQRFNGGKGVEGIGIAPDEIVEYDPKLILEGVDPCIARAEELLGSKKGLPKGAVSYVPPARR